MASRAYLQVGDHGDDNLQGGGGVDIIDLGSGDDTAGGGRCFNIILGGSDADFLRSEGVFDDILAGSGNDTIVATGYGAWLFGGSGDDTITGSDKHWCRSEIIFGGSGDDTIDGRGGSDIIIGGEGDDDLTGGRGADTFVFEEGHGNDTIQDFSFGDRIQLTCFDQTITWEQLQSKITTVTNDENVVTGVQIDLSEWGGGTIVLNGFTSVDDVTENMFVLDQIVGSDGSDDTLQGGTSADTMTGGTGADTFVFDEDSGSDTITDFSKTEGDKIDLTSFSQAITWAQLSTKITTVTDDDNTVTGVQIDLSDWGGGTITLNGITSVSDVTADMFVLHALTGRDGLNDTLQGGTGDDTLSGGTGPDTFVFVEDSGNDTITDFYKSERDKIDLSGFNAKITWEELSTKITTVTNADNVVTGVRIDLSDWGGGTITLQGGIRSVSDVTADMFELPDGSTRWLYGTEDADTIDGGAGQDVIYGMEGGDTLRGGGGHDWLFGDEGADRLEGGGGDDLLMGGEGDDVLIAGEGDDMLVGGEGDDTLTGGGGADAFIFAPGHGSDTITDFTQGEDTINLRAFTDITSFADLNGSQVGGDTMIVLDANTGDSIRLTGVQFSDLSASDFTFYQNEYTGTAGADTLNGGAGDDTITGLGGDDTLTGGEGADTFVFAAGHGNDTITDFTDGEDAIDLSAFTGISGFDDLTVAQNGEDTVITVPGGGTITLQDFTSTDLDANDFVFHEEQQDSI